MELIKNKSELIIQSNYKPNINGSLIDYFNRALVFSQTNYGKEIELAVKANFSKLTPTKFINFSSNSL